jgi:23S rRNA (adenine2503-C2)-methyltransferase
VAHDPAAISAVDFRDLPPSRVHALLADRGWNERKILNFNHALRSQDVTGLGGLRGVRDLEPLLPLLPMRTLALGADMADREGNRKLSFRTADGHAVESVFMPGKKLASVCISVQAGCRLGCRFCATGRMGFGRSLLPHEMLEQVRRVYLRHVHPEHLGCVTFMGMGEPFDNLESCRTAFDWIRSDWGWSVGAKRVTFSTTGARGWEEFLSFPVLPNLAVSLHAAREEVRRSLMPGVRIGLEELRGHMLAYARRENKQVSVEYCLLRGVNDSPDDAGELVSYLQGVPCKVNLLNYNPDPRMEGRGEFSPVTQETLLRFRDRVSRGGLPVLYRRSLGTEIGAGCGQLGGVRAREQS